VNPATARRRELRAAGFEPIPVNGKAAVLPGWQNKTAASDEEILLWERLFPYAGNTGALTRLMPTPDIDILNPYAAEAIECLVHEHFEERGFILIRIGKPPKRAIPFRTDTPFAKITASVTAPDGSGDQKVEMLASGQQVVIDGIHPDTGRPYRWHHGVPGRIALADLPYIQEDDARKLVDEIVELLVRDYGYARAADRPGKAKRGNGADTGAGAAGWQYLFDNIREGRDLHNSLRDLAAKMIASGMAAGAAVNQLRALMESTAPPVRDERWHARYSDIPRLVESAEKFATQKHDDSAPSDQPDDIRIGDFVAYMPMYTYIFTPTRDTWPAASVNARIKSIPQENGKAITASAWLDTTARPDHNGS
jgi:hypothetical protein